MSAAALEESRAALELVAAPLRQAVEVLPPDLQDGLELRVGQVPLEVEAVDVGRQAVVGDEQQVVGVELGGLVQQVRGGHVGQRAAHAGGAGVSRGEGRAAAAHRHAAVRRLRAHNNTLHTCIPTTAKTVRTLRKHFYVLTIHT